MNTLTSKLVLLGVLACASTGAALAQTPAAPERHAPGLQERQEHFERARAFTLRALDERQAILARERLCVEGAHNPRELSACHVEARGRRDQMTESMRPGYEALRRQKPE